MNNEEEQRDKFEIIGDIDELGWNEYFFFSKDACIWWKKHRNNLLELSFYHRAIIGCITDSPCLLAGTLHILYMLHALLAYMKMIIVCSLRDLLLFFSTFLFIKKKKILLLFLFWKCCLVAVMPMIHRWSYEITFSVYRIHLSFEFGKLHSNNYQEWFIRYSIKSKWAVRICILIAFYLMFISFDESCKTYTYINV